MKSQIANRKSQIARPFVFINVAMTADGKLATANRAVSSFGSPLDQKNLLELRATADAVMSGARTVDLNAVTLGPGAEKYRRSRRRRRLSEYNLRVIVSGSGSINPRAEIFRHKFSPIIILVSGRAGARRIKALRAVADDVKICGKNDINFRLALQWLRKTWKVRRLLCEGGGEVNEGLFHAGVVDEVHVTITPFIFGGRQAATMADGRGFSSLSRAAKLHLKSARRCGKELFLVYGVRSFPAGPSRRR